MSYNQTQMINNISQYHPLLQNHWKNQMTGYLPYSSNHENPYIYHNQRENFIDWDDPYKNIRPWKIIDFLREFKLTK